MRNIEAGEVREMRLAGNAADCDTMDETQIQSAIALAKREWECTADALPHIVCLLDGHGRTVRVNRVVETWQLGPVGNVIGRDLHLLLHPAGCSAPCELETRMRECWSHVRQGRAQEFEITDAVLQRSIAVSLRPIVADASARVPPGHASAAVAISDVTDLELARSALQAMNHSLEARVRERTTELEEANRDLSNAVVRRQTAEEALRQSRNELMHLSQQLINAQESERRRIARELHDSIGQSLSAVKYSLERACELQRQDRVADSQALLNRMVLRVQETIAEVRDIAMDLRPALLDDLGAASAIGWLCREFADTYPGINMQVDVSATDGGVPQRLATTVFRCAQELLNNVAKHSQANTVIVELIRNDNVLSLKVADDGIGAPHASLDASVTRGYGIRNLRERAQMTGGRMQLTANVNGGTLVRIEWPLLPHELP